MNKKHTILLSSIRVFIILPGIMTMLAGCATTNLPPANPGTAKDHYLRGAKYHNQNNCDLAIPEYTQAIMMDPDYVDAYFMRALCSFCKNINETIADLTQVIKVRPNVGKYYHLRGAAYSMIGDLEHAGTDNDMALALDPNNYGLILGKANRLFSEKKFADAIPFYQIYQAYLQKVTPSVSIVVAKTFLTSGLIGVAFDPMGEIKGTQDAAERVRQVREKVLNIIKLCEAMVSQNKSNEFARPITKGMSMFTVLQISMATEMLVAGGYSSLDDDLIVTLNRTGPPEDWRLKIFVFMNDQLTIEKRFTLKEIPDVLEKSRLDIPMKPAPTKNGVLEIVRKTDQVIYDDENRIITIAQWEGTKGNRLKILRLKNDKLTSYNFSPRPLW